MSFSRRQEIKKTRKPHLCYFCASTITAGSPAVYFTGVVEGDFYADYNHKDCVEIWDLMRDNELIDCGEGVDEGYINEVMDEYLRGCTDKAVFLEWLRNFNQTTTV